MAARGSTRASAGAGAPERGDDERIARGTADRGSPPPPTRPGSLSAEGLRQVANESGRLRRRGPASAAGAAIVVGLVALIVVGAVTGNGALLVALAVLVVLAAGAAIAQGIFGRYQTRTDEAAADDPSARREPMAGALHPASQDVALGDTGEAHDEISYHDLPPDHPGRHAAEQRAASGDARARTTRGDAELNRAAPGRSGRAGEPGGA